MDAINRKAIHRRYGERPLRNDNTISFFEYYIWYPFVKRMLTVRPLNYMPYDKAKSVDQLERAVGWRAYGRKHGESQFTKLFQNYYRRVRFGYDKRRPHLSSLIVSGQMTREDAVEKLAEPLASPNDLEVDVAYFCKKLRISRAEFDQLMQAPVHRYSDFPTWHARYRLLKQAQSALERVTGRRIGALLLNVSVVISGRTANVTQRKDAFNEDLSPYIRALSQRSADISQGMPLLGKRGLRNFVGGRRWQG